MNVLTKMKRRFAEYTEDELNDLIESKDAENTKKVIANAVNILSQYAAESCGNELKTVEELQVSELAGL